MAMAAWQVDFYLIPRRALAASAALTPAVLRDTDWWAINSFPSDYRLRLSNVAASARSTSPNLETWGEDGGNRVDVRSADGRVCRVMARVDVRRLDSKFGAALIVFARAADALLVRGDGLIVEPVINAYAGALRNSEAWRFANDPAAFLAAHQKSLEEDE
jgi:hypothetical protein